MDVGAAWVNSGQCYAKIATAMPPTLLIGCRTALVLRQAKESQMAWYSVRSVV